MSKMIHRGPNGDVTKIIRIARKAGWAVEASRKHIKWTSPSGYFTYTPATPRRGDTRSLRRQLKKGGLEV